MSKDDTLMKTFPQGLPVGIVNATFATTTITKCAAANAIDMSKLTTCYNGPDGTKYLQAAKDATPPHKAIPILVVAGNTSCPPPKDVIGAVCAAYTGTHPNCTKHEENVEIAQPCNTEYCSQITVDVDTGAEASFRTFLTTYNKEYKNATEFAYRLGVFKKNLQIAEQRNADGEAVHGITKFSDLTNEEFRSFYLGYKAPTGARQELDIALTDSSAAASVDWRGHSPAILTPVKNQAQCGSCWAFSATEQIETNYAMAGNAIKSLGVQQIVSCDKVDEGCNGGNTETAYAYVEKAGGLETEASYPYTSGKGKSGVCKDKKAKEVVSIKGFNTISKTEASEKKMVTQMGDSPISVCVDATKWQTYKKGILGRTCGKQLDHCVQAVGLNTDGANRCPPCPRRIMFYVLKICTPSGQPSACEGGFWCV
jgi:C1A family cysteine protease